MHLLPVNSEFWICTSTEAQNQPHFSGDDILLVAYIFGIQAAALLVIHWISYGHPARIKRAGYLLEFHLPIALAVI